jgi:hypothetical protein
VARPVVPRRTHALAVYDRDMVEIMSVSAVPGRYMSEHRTRDGRSSSGCGQATCSAIESESTSTQIVIGDREGHAAGIRLGTD